MIRIRDRVIIIAHDLAHELLYRNDSHHLTTDPLCERYRPVKPRSRLDRRSRGISCGRCMMRRAFTE